MLVLVIDAAKCGSLSGNGIVDFLLVPKDVRFLLRSSLVDNFGIILLVLLYSGTLK